VERFCRRVSTLSVKYIGTLGSVLVGDFVGLIAPLSALTCIWSRDLGHEWPAVQIDLDAVPCYKPPIELVRGGEDMGLASWVAETRLDAQLLFLSLYKEFRSNSLLCLLLV
jgi:hypothetical protein